MHTLARLIAKMIFSMKVLLIAEAENANILDNNAPTAVRMALALSNAESMSKPPEKPQQPNAPLHAAKASSIRLARLKQQETALIHAPFATTAAMSKDNDVHLLRA